MKEKEENTSTTELLPAIEKKKTKGRFEFLGKAANTFIGKIENDNKVDAILEGSPSRTHKSTFLSKIRRTSSTLHAKNNAADARI
jgi:hypothetical protein